ncbi:MAG: hydroxysqualene dehydroxylase HpnE [Azonexus sp.]|nr:hydroxysqualene dehydroxylase HpnE [Azonexus sp.]
MNTRAPGPRIAVIGGGWAGIAAAVDLAAAGVAVTLYEAGRAPGGRARGVDIAGRRVDNGQHILLGAYRETLALMRRIGADPERLLARYPFRVVNNAAFRLALPRLPAPLHVAWGLLAARGVGWREKLSAARWIKRLKQDHFRLADDGSVAAWLDAAGQTGVLRRQLWEPLCLAALNTPVAEASAQLFANVLRDSLGSPRRADTDLLLPRVDLSRLLPEPASDWLAARGADLRLSTRVRALDLDADAVRVDGETYAAAILATAPRHAARLWPALGGMFADQPIATLYLQYPASVRLPFALQKLDGPLGQWVVDRGNGLLACILSGHGGWEEVDDETLTQRLAAELALGQPGWRQIIRERRATFSATPNLPRPAPSLAPHLFLAGDYTWAEYPATLEGAVRSGRRAAELALAAA